MKANENLMVGDWVKFKGSDLYHQVKVVSNKSIKVDNQKWFAKSSVEPIPLTAEILEKNGFKKKGHRYGIYDDYYDFEMYEYNDGTWIVSYHCCETPLPDEQLVISYVHQLQLFMRHCVIEKEIIL